MNGWWWVVLGVVVGAVLGSVVTYYAVRALTSVKEMDRVVDEQSGADPYDSLMSHDPSSSKDNGPHDRPAKWWHDKGAD